MTTPNDSTLPVLTDDLYYYEAAERNYLLSLGPQEIAAALLTHPLNILGRAPEIRRAWVNGDWGHRGEHPNPGQPIAEEFIDLLLRAAELDYEAQWYTDRDEEHRQRQREQAHALRVEAGAIITRRHPPFTTASAIHWRLCRATSQLLWDSGYTSRVDASP